MENPCIYTIQPIAAQGSDAEPRNTRKRLQLALNTFLTEVIPPINLLTHLVLNERENRSEERSLRVQFSFESVWAISCFEQATAFTDSVSAFYTLLPSIFKGHG